MLPNVIVLESLSDLLNLKLFSNDFYTLLFRLSVNLVFMTIIIRYLYYPITKRKDYLDWVRKKEVVGWAGKIFPVFSEIWT